MGLLDLGVLTVFLSATVWTGLSRSSEQTTVSDYFTTGRRAPWGMVMASIVATETSTVTLVSLPGFAFANDLTFLQLVFGYLLGRAIVTALLIPAYFRGKYVTAYQVLTERFGSHVGRVAAAIFLGTRNLSDGFRLFGTGLVLGAVILTVPGAEGVAARVAPSIDPATTILVWSVMLLGAVTMAYTYFGGMSAVLWTDALQLVMYIGGSLVAAVVLLQLIPGGWHEVVEVGTAAGRFRVFDFSWDPTRSYTFWSGLIGGACLTVSTHGTDQLIVQRYLCSGSAREASRALMWSGVVVLGQFVLFLIIGVMLHVYYTGYAPAALDMLAADGPVRTDRIFPMFIVTQLPAGVRGLMVAAIFAAAMSTLSSSLNASASTTLADFYMPATGGRRSARHYLRLARRSTMAWGLFQIAVAIAAVQLSGRIVDEVLGISSFTNGLILGIFLLGLAGYRRPSTAFAAIGTGATLMLAVRFLTDVSWQWYVLIGASSTWTTGWLTARFTETPHDD